MIAALIIWAFTIAATAVGWHVFEIGRLINTIMLVSATMRRYPQISQATAQALVYRWTLPASRMRAARVAQIERDWLDSEPDHMPRSLAVVMAEQKAEAEEVERKKRASRANRELFRKQGRELENSMAGCGDCESTEISNWAGVIRRNISPCSLHAPQKRGYLEQERYYAARDQRDRMMHIMGQRE